MHKPGDLPDRETAMLQGKQSRIEGFLTGILLFVLPSALSGAFFIALLFGKDGIYPIIIF